jgi:hypothetical protein
MSRRAAPFAAALLATQLFAAPLASADEFDWVYFPMFKNDTAHAVHLRALKFRPDGLLSAATRYPRASHEAWPEEIAKAAWYDYAERLIDCETGFHVDTAQALLGQDGARLATQADKHALQVTRLEDELRKSDKRWPDNSEIFLACAAASNPSYRQRRAALAARTQPLWSDKSLVQTLIEQDAALIQTATLRYDFGPIERRRSASAADLFQDMRAQFARWRSAINAAYAPPKAIPAADKALLKEANRQLAATGVPDIAIKSLKGSIIEHVVHSEDSVHPFGQDATGRGGLVLDTVRIDCAYGVSVAVARQVFSPSGKQRSSGPLAARAVLADVKAQYQRAPDGQDGGPFGGHALDRGADAMCQLIDALRHPEAQQQQQQSEEPSAPALPYGLTRAALERHSTPAAMLLEIRAAQRKHPR